MLRMKEVYGTPCVEGNKRDAIGMYDVIIGGMISYGRSVESKIW